MTPHPAGRATGFTLVEVLVALAIAMLSLTLMTDILRDGLGGSRRIERQSEALILAQSALESLGVVAPLRDGEVASLRKDPFRIDTRVARYGPPGESQGYLAPYSVTVTVSWDEGGHSRSLALSTIRLGAPG